MRAPTSPRGGKPGNKKNWTERPLKAEKNLGNSYYNDGNQADKKNSATNCCQSVSKSRTHNLSSRERFWCESVHNATAHTLH